MTIETGYKIVTYELERRTSLINTSTSSRDIIYKKDEWVFPKDGFGPLCLFKDFYSAIDFSVSVVVIWKRGKMEIWKCDFVQSKLRYIWDGMYEIPLISLPKGTILASAIRLTKMERKNDRI